MKFAAFVAVFLAVLASSQACRCPALAAPAMCRTDYLMLVKITGAALLPPANRVYYFQLYRDISYPHPYNADFQYIQTGYDDGSCYLQLEVGKFYLLGGMADVDTGILTATTCYTYWEEWPEDENCLVSDLSLTKIERKCRKFRDNPVIIGTVLPELEP